MRDLQVNLSMLWKIADTPHRLLGSVHTLAANAVLPAWCVSSYSGIKRFIFESDIRGLLEIKSGIDPTLGHLKFEGASEIYERAKAVFASLGMNKPFEAMLPWRAAMFLANQVIPTIGLSFDHGVDNRLRMIADTNRLTVDFLEAPTRSFELIDLSCKNAQGGLAFLDQVITDAQSGAGKLELQRIVRAWFTSDLTDFESIRNKEIGRFPFFYNPMLVQRDREWLPIARTMIADKTPTLFVVGSLHTVGPGSFVEHLESAGFRLNFIG